MQGYFVGIDPGVTGGIGILNDAGEVVGAHRWQVKKGKGQKVKAADNRDVVGLLQAQKGVKNG